jgi:NADPH-dependent 2,4-dienoyl-CoA reductase/sulfur reductase-like enzyme/nitrite reductase/ring-hydroxylating ferredoxin subunit
MAEHAVGAAEGYLQDGQMTRTELEGKPVVVARVAGEYFAFGGNCPHYGAPLNEGVLDGHTLMCPWHHACFDLRTAARVEPPTLNDLARYPVKIADGQVFVTLPNDNERQPVRVNFDDPRTFVIVGGGAAGNAAAEQLVRAGFGGKIVILSDVPTVPLDRPNLSKDYLAGKAQPDWVPLRSEAWYADEKRQIALRLNTHVARVDAPHHTVILDNGEAIRYDKLLLATGAKPRDLADTPGTDLRGVFKLREMEDADAIIQAAQDAPNKRVVIIGASFIALEAAASLAGGRGLNVTVVGIEAVPFEKVFGAEIGALFQREHEANGVQFRLNSGVAQIVGTDGTVEAVELKSGERLQADFVLIGVGVRPNTDFLKDSGINMHERDGSLIVNAQLQTSEPDIYAAGDIARVNTDTDDVRIEHWRVAQQHGLIAANNMLGSGQDGVPQHVPFFWTSQWGLDFTYVGHAEKWDEIIYRGHPSDGDGKDFVAFYVAEGTLRAATSAHRHNADMDAVEIILRDPKKVRGLTLENLRDAHFDLVAYAGG